MSDGIQISRIKRSLWIAVFFIAVLLISLLGHMQFRIEEEQEHSERAQELTAIGALKAGQIAEWRKERLSDAIRFAQGPTLTRAIAKADRDDLQIMLTLNRKADFYEEALLVSPSFDILASATGATEPLTEASRWAVEKAINTAKPALSDFFLSTNDTVHIDVAAPVINDAHVAVGALVLRCSASDYLYPLIQSWPVPSVSAETVLVRRQGDMAIFLNKLRYQSHNAMKLKIPLTQRDVVAVQALLGKRGIVKGIDYRGSKVLADARPIPDSDWFLITKVDRSEISHRVRHIAVAIASFSFMGILFAAAVTAFGFRNRQASLYRHLYHAEQEQRASVEKYRTILYSIGDAVITTDHQHLVQQMNPIAENLTGWSEAEAMGHPLEDVFHIINEEIRVPVENPAKKVLRDGKIVGLANHTVLIARNGKEYHITDSGAPIRDEQGNIIGVVLVFRDQSAERIAQKALVESERRLSTLMDNLPGMAYRCRMDSYWTMEFISQGCIALTGYQVADLIDNARMSFFDLIHPEDRQYVWDTVVKSVDQRGTYTLEYRITTADGVEKWVWERGCAVRNQEGAVEALEGFIHDITERKQAAAEQSKLQDQLNQSQKIEAIGQLAGGVAHDFNNMLSVIIGNAELADEQLDPSSPLHVKLGEILKAGKHSASLVKQLLGFARKQNIKPRKLDLNDTISGLCDMLRRLIGEMITLEWVPDAHLWPVLMDPSQVDQILINLTVNASDAITGAGTITVTTSNVSHGKPSEGTLAEAPYGEYVLISVSDNGCGMDAVTQSHIFEPFFTTKPHGFGTGLGLSTVYGIVKQNNGFIRVNSQPGQGSCFKIYLPRYRPTKETEAEVLYKFVAAEPSKRGPDPAPPPEPKTILLVEDESSVLSLTQTLLKKIGHTVISANGPKEAIQLARDYAGDIHLLLTDVVMPEMSGRDLWQNLVKEHPKLKVLFMSGYTANIIAHHGMIDTNIHFLQKPFTKEDLTAKVREVLSS